MRKSILIVWVLFITGGTAASNPAKEKPTAPQVVVSTGGEVSLHVPQLAGIFRLGMGTGKESFWLDEMKCEKKLDKEGGLTLTWRQLLGKDDRLVLRFRKLIDTAGFILEAESSGLPDGAQMYWAFGACYGQKVNSPMNCTLEPAYCKDNVFSVEGTAFTAYYGESMALRIVQGVTPPDADIRLSDAHSLQSPSALFQSGKKTDAPLLSAAYAVKNGEKYYFCFYIQNRAADYNYFMLPELFIRESRTQ